MEIIKTCEEETYERLKQLILSGELPSGDFLPQRGLAQRVGATLVTLRSALRLLGNDGLIENIPRWGVRIPVEDARSLSERYYVRELLEVGAVEKLLEHPSPGMKEELLALARECDRMKPENPQSCRIFAEKHARFHLRIAEFSGNRMLTQTLSRLNFRTMMLSNARNGWMIQKEYSLEAHHEHFILDIFSLPLADALSAVRAHIRRGLRMELAVLQQQEKSAADVPGFTGEPAR